MSKADPFVGGLGQPFARGDEGGASNGSEFNLGCTTRTMQLTHLIFNIALLVGSVAFFAVGVNWYNDHNWLTVCKPCQQVVMFVIVTANFVAIASIVGIMVAFRRHRILAIAYVFFMILLFLLCLAWFIALCIAYAGYFTEYVQRGWEDNTKNDPETVCSLQSTFKCSGWNQPCVTRAPTPAPSHLNSPQLTQLRVELFGLIPCANCTVNPDDDDFARTCENVIRDGFNQAFLSVLLVGVIGCILTSLLLWLTWNIRRVNEGYEPT